MTIGREAATPDQQPETQEELTHEGHCGDGERRTLGEHRDETVEGIPGPCDHEQDV